MAIYLYRSIMCLIIIPVVFFAQQTLAVTPINDLAASYQFLIGNYQYQGGALYRATAGDLNGKDLPLSYFDSANYWGDYVCHIKGNQCAVKDIYNSSNYTLLPKAGHAGDLQTVGPKLVDEWFGFGASYKAWQQVKHYGGYGVGTTLWGVGYSDKDGNGIDNNGHYKQGILSAEWTAGAINMVRDMVTYYQSIAKNNTHFKLAQDYVAHLQVDESSMIKNVQTLRFNNYETTTFPGKPANYKALLPSETFQPYLYASKRYMIPFGWFANPIPSTCSTSWMIMLAHHYDPFQYGGK